MTAPVGAVDVRAWQALAQTLRGTAGAEQDPLVRLAGLSFEAAVADAIAHAPASAADPQAPVEGAEPVPATAEAPTPTPAATPAGSVPDREAHAIQRESARTGIDPSLLVALRKTENGGPGREFGVLSVAAPDLDGQARVAANSVRNTLQRFERSGQAAVDPATGRYTEAFLRYFSGRYAPVGAANDPAGVNRHHAANLIARYQKAADRGGDG